MRKRILADYWRDFFSGEAHHRPDQEHPEFRGTERFRFAKISKKKCISLPKGKL